MISFLTEPFTYEFMQRALLAAILAGGVAALAGTFVVLRGMVFLGDALAHAVLPGMAVAYVAGQNLFIGALLAALFTSFGVGYVSQRQQLHYDTAIGILFSGMFALGIAIISTMRSYTVDLTAMLFGNVLAVSNQELTYLALLSCLILLAIFTWGRGWALLAFDADYAAGTGLPVKKLHYTLLLVVALAVVSAMQAVGVVMVLAMLVVPPATARLVTQQLPIMMLCGVLFSTSAACGGLYASYYLNIASGAAIVLAGVLQFFIVLFYVQMQEKRQARFSKTEVGS
jgi:ABC-type Mn2+/Zn2+ transport system permease subunit